MNKRVIAGALCGLALVLGCAKPPTQDPNPQPDHGARSKYTACPRVDTNTVCVEFYSDEEVTIHIRVTGLNGDGVSAPLIDRNLAIYPSGGAAGFELPLDVPPVAIGGRAAGPRGVTIGCRILVRGLEVHEAGQESDKGSVVCLFTTH